MKRPNSAINKYLIVIAISLLIVATIFVLTNNQSTIRPDVLECMRAKQQLYKSETILPGTILLTFSSNFTNESISSLIKSYGLTGSILGTIREHTFVDVYVPNGKEFEWMCIFEKNNATISTDINRPMHGFG